MVGETKKSLARVLFLVIAAGLLASLVACAGEEAEVGKAVTPEEQLKLWKECALHDIDHEDEEVRAQYRERASAVLDKYIEQLMRIPGATSFGVGGLSSPHDDEAEWAAWGASEGIVVGVLEPVDWSKVPEEDRIGDCLDGVPVKVYLTQLAGPG